MCLINKLNNKYIILTEVSIILAVSIVHIVFGIVLITHKFTKFDIYNLFDSSPLFDFSIDTHCKDKKAVVFHTWGGWKEEVQTDDGKEIVIHDRTDIKKINGYFFCYKNIPYKRFII